MNRWEYLKVDYEKTGGIHRVRSVNDIEVSNWKTGRSVAEYANQLGLDGWEIAAASPTESGTLSPLMTVWFRRQRA